MKNSDAFERRLNAYVEAKAAHEQQAEVLVKEKVAIFQDFLKEHGLDDVVIAKISKVKGKLLISRFGIPEFHPLKKDGSVSSQTRGYIFTGGDSAWMQKTLEDILENYEAYERDDEMVKAATNCGMSWQGKQKHNKKGN